MSEPNLVEMIPMESDPTVGARGSNDFVKLVNPVRTHFETFIFANALACTDVVQQGGHEGETVVICGAGPSLRETADKWVPHGHQVWGCNSALVWLHEHGYPVTHGYTIDQQPQMVEEWYSAPEVEYLLASTVHPHLTEWLASRGRHFTFFHNYVGLKKPPVEWCKCGHDAKEHEDGERACGQCGCQAYDRHMMEFEDWLYSSLYPTTLRAGSGLNSTTRAIDVALFMGFEEIILLGADCSIRFNTPRPPEAKVGTDAHRRWLEQATEMHADGGHALASGATATVFEGVIDGRTWLTKPDLAITAVWLERWRRRLEAARQKDGTGPRLRIMGDTLPRALRNKDDRFLDRLPSLVDESGKTLQLR